MYTNIDALDLLNQPDEGDPLVWLRKHREELSARYPTVEALLEYYQSVPTVEEISNRLKNEIAELETVYTPPRHSIEPRHK